MKKQRLDQGFTAVEVVITVLVVAALGLGGWYVWSRNHDDSKTKQNSQTQAGTKQSGHGDNTNSKADPSEGGKYLVITEWGVRALLPEALRGKVVYTISEAIDPDTKLPLQAAKIYVAASSVPNSECTVEAVSTQPSINSAAQYIRSDASKSFNANRYKGTVNADLLGDGGYAFHLNYLEPVCVSGDGLAVIDSLDAALINLEKIQ